MVPGPIFNDFRAARCSAGNGWRRPGSSRRNRDRTSSPAPAPPASRRAAQPVHLTDDQEHRQGDDNELDHDVDEGPVVDGRGAGRPRLGQAGIGAVAEIDEEIAEIDVPEQQADRRHHHVVDQRRRDLAERGPHDECDGKVDDVAAQGEFAELLDQVHGPLRTVLGPAHRRRATGHRADAIPVEGIPERAVRPAPA